jgi:hypothetical protein
MRIEQVRDFRIDHCCFEHTCYGIFTFGGRCRGVVDHCFFVNKHGKVGAPLDECTVGYGVQYGREYGDAWEDDARKVLGQYTDYTIVYFSREAQKEVSKCFPRDWWIWDNQLAAGVSLLSQRSRIRS